MMDQIVLSNFTLEQFKDTIQGIVRSELKEHHQNSIFEKEYLNRSETAILLKCTVTTVNNWVKRGILNKYYVSGKRLYRKDEVLAAIKKMEKKY